MSNRLYRSRRDRWLGGVCGGLGMYFGIDPVIIRLVFVALTVWGGMGILAYLILWILMPPEERIESPYQDVMRSNVEEIEQRAHEFAQEARDVWQGRGVLATPQERTLLVASALILIGFILLIGNLFGVSLIHLWPVLLILLGAYLLYQAIVRR